MAIILRLPVSISAPHERLIIPVELTREQGRIIAEDPIEWLQRLLYWPVSVLQETTRWVLAIDAELNRELSRKSEVDRLQRLIQDALRQLPRN
jgi:hypothetical protein